MKNTYIANLGYIKIRKKERKGSESERERERDIK